MQSKSYKLIVHSFIPARICFTWTKHFMLVPEILHWRPETSKDASKKELFFLTWACLCGCTGGSYAKGAIKIFMKRRLNNLRRLFGHK